MNLFPQTRNWLTDRILPLSVLGVLLLFTVGWLDVAPYVGFYHTSTGVVTEAYGPDTPEHLRVGDQIIQIDDVTWEDYESDLRQPLFTDVETGDTLKMTIIRDGEEITLDWVIPPKTPGEISARLINIWWLAYFFWIAGTATLLLVRPRDTRWKLMIAFNYLTAIWLVAGNLSSSHLLASPLAMRIAIWMCLPVYLQLHWNLPKPLMHTPKVLWYVLYAFAFVAAVTQWFQIIPKSSYLFAFLGAILGSVLLLFLHFLFRKEQRRDITILLIGTLLTMLPQIAPAMAEFNSGFNTLYIFAFLALPFLPSAYFYTLYRRQLIGMELRANHLISGYIYLIVVMIVFSLWLPFALERFAFQGAGAFISLFAVFLATLFTIVGYERFSRFVERRILNMPLASSELLQSYTDRIATSLDTASLEHLINEEILPSLLIRQSALLDLAKEKQVEVVCSKGITPDQLPPESQVTHMSASSSPIPGSSEIEGHAWIRLALPLRVGDELVGFWLLGQRDPDNVYNANDIITLRSLANQTAIALANINQAEMLQMLYRANISSQEIERGRLARDLHDVVLNQLALLNMKLDEAAAEAFHEDYQTLIKYLRQTIQGLRPPALNYGLRTALEAFCDDLSDRANGDLEIEFEIEPCDTHFDPTIESHLYRIIQQAGENAIRHAQAKHLHLYGKISQTEIELHLRDDGVGFNTRSGLDLSTLLTHEHFGLVGMYERARIINAHLKIDSLSRKGTTITVTWRPDDLPAS